MDVVVSNVQLAGAMDVLNAKMDLLISAIDTARPGMLSESTRQDARPNQPAKAKRTRSKSAYNVYMSEELAKLKVSHPDLGHRKRFAMAVGSWPSAKAARMDQTPGSEADTGVGAGAGASSTEAPPVADAEVSANRPDDAEPMLTDK